MAGREDGEDIRDHQRSGRPDGRCVEGSFRPRDAAIEWVILHQFGRRNLSAMVRGDLAPRLKPIIAARAEEREKSGKSD